MVSSGKILDKKHFPVMLKEVLNLCLPYKNGSFLDCTFGSGGYVKKLLEFPESKVSALDRDGETLELAKKIKLKYKSRFSFYHEKFSNLDKIFSEEKFNVIIFDLGISSIQLKDYTRGFSFNAKGSIDMRMGLSDTKAEKVLNEMDEKDLKFLIKFFGEEREANIIVKNILENRKKRKIETVEQLVNIIIKSKKRHFKKRINPCTKTFQALRIFVNKEITELTEGLQRASKYLLPGGKIILISFHSIEDKIIKIFFKENSDNNLKTSRYLPEVKTKKKYLFEKYKNKIFTPSKEEIEKNPPSRSAKLRFAIRSNDKFYQSSDLSVKFKKFLEFEKKNDQI